MSTRLGRLRIKHASNPDVTVLIIIVAVFLAYLFSHLFFGSVALTPEENVRSYYQTLTYDKQDLTLSYNQPLNQQFDTTLIKPRNTVINQQGQIVPSDFLGIYLAMMPITKIIGLKLTNAYLFATFSALGVLAVYLVAKELFNHRIGIFAMTLVAAFPVYVYWSDRAMTDIPSLALCLLGVYCFIKSRDSPHAWAYAVSAGFFMGFGASIKYTNAVLVFLACLLYFPYRKLAQVETYIKYVGLLACMIISLVPVLMLNQRLYGGILQTGQAAYAGSSTIIRTSASISLASSATRYFVTFAGVVTILFVISCFYTLKFGSADKLRFLGLVIIYGTLAIFIFGKQDDVFGAHSPIVQLSYSQPRYFLGVYMLMILLACGFFYFYERYVKGDSRLELLIVGLVAPSYIISSFSYNGSGIFTVHSDSVTAEQLNAVVQASTPRNALIFTQLDDKELFPDRQVVSYYNSGLEPLGKRTQNAAALAHNLVLAGKPIYWMNEQVTTTTAQERGYGTLSDYQRALAQHNLTLKAVNKNLYQVSKTH